MPRRWIIFTTWCALSLPALADPPAAPHKNIFEMPSKSPATQPVKSATQPAPTTQAQPATMPVATRPMRIPSETELIAASARVNDLFGKDVAGAKTADEKLDLAETMISTAVDEKNDPAAVFQTLLVARDLAVKGQDFRLACRAIQQLGQRFYIDPLAYEAAAAAAFRATPIPISDRRLFCLQIESLIKTMVAQSRFDLIPGMDEIARSVAASSDAALARQVRRFSEEHASETAGYAALADVRETLRKDPANRPANTALGRYKCFDEDDWEHGLPLLAAGSDVQLRQLAQADGANASADQKFLLANMWWEIAQQQGEIEKQRILDHTGPLYIAALPTLTGLEKAIVIKRLVSIKAAMIGEPAAVDLLDLVDVPRDTVKGKWKLADVIGTLTSASAIESRITFLYHPPRDYDFRVVFTRLDGNGAIDLFCIGGEGDRQFRYILGAYDNTVAGFSLVQAMTCISNITTMHNTGVENQKRCTLVIRVRSDNVAAFLNDKPLGNEYRTDFRDLGPYPGTELNRPDVVGLMATNSKFIIHSAYVVEVAGHGHRVGQNDSAETPIVASITYTGPANSRRPFLVTLHANGTADSSLGLHASWFVHGSELAFRWGDDVDSCKLSSDRKSFTGKTNWGDAVKGEITDGGI